MKVTAMEQSHEKIIRDKIRETEQAPANWNSEWVWTRVETTGMRKKNWALYAAASLLIGMVAISIYWQSFTYERNMMTNLDRIESQINSLYLLPLQAVITDEKCNTEVVAKEHFAHALKNKNALPKVTSTPDVELLIELNSPDPQLNISHEVSVVQAETPNQVLAIKKERQVKPIVGKIPQATDVITATRSAEIRITVFESPTLKKENAIVEASAFKIINTRINTH